VALIDAGHYKRARAILEPRLQANPNDAEAACLLSGVQEAFQDFEGALKLAQKAVDLEPKNAKYQYQLAQV
jgi:cytochrome c-type biogenesis protein CcmH/NrfG